MAKKNLSANAEKLGANDVTVATSDNDKVKFICEFPEYHFFMKELDDNGKVMTHTDANGNNALPNILEFHFTKVQAHKNADGKVDPTTAFCFFIASKEEHGKNYDRILKKLNADCKNPRNKMYTADDHWKKRNPEAFRIATEKAEMEDKIAEKDRQIEELKRKLGFKN